MTTRPLKPFAVFDIEAEAWDRFTLAVAQTSDGETIHFDTRQGLQAWVESWPGKAFAHYGGGYDFLFLTGKKRLVLSGSNILSAKCGKATLKDSGPLFLQSLKRIGKAVGLEKLEVDRGHIERLTREEAFTYCERDCAILMKALLEHRAWCLESPHPRPKWPTTSGSAAVYWAEAFEPETVDYMARHAIDWETWEAHSTLVNGGRCELWQLGHVPGPVYVYDVKSSYPARYFEAPLPVGPYRWTSKEVEAPGVYRVRFRQPRNRLPLLSVDGVHVHSGEGWATSEEIRVAREELGAWVDVQEGWVSDGILPFGRRFASELYRLKESGNPWAKVHLNSLHGKLGQRVVNRAWELVGRTYVEAESLSPPRWFQRPMVEAFILARARVALWRVLDRLERAGEKVLYTDTDSCHTSCPPERFEALTGAKLGAEPGQWALEKTATRALYLAPKAYALELEGGGHAFACKGFPKERVSWELFASAWERPVEVALPWGLQGFLSGPRTPEAGAKVRDFTRTLRAHPGVGKRRSLGDAVWYAH